MKKPLFLHIGRPKAGSSALQAFLSRNRSALVQRGILYPESTMHGDGSHKLALVFQPKLRDARAVADTSAVEIYESLSREAAVREVCQVVASSENLFLVDPSLPARHLRENFDTKIVCYVRRQDEVLVSSLLQEIKSGTLDPDCDIEAYVRVPERLRLLDYTAVLDSWAQQFGDENIIVRPFEHAQMAGTIFEDFMAVVGCSTEGLVAPSSRINPSPARDVLEYIRMINDAQGLGDAFKGRLHTSLLELSESMGSHGRFDAKSLVPARLRQQIMDRFSRSNAMLAKRYLGRNDGVLFTDTVRPNSEPVEPYSGLDLERFARMTAVLFCAQQQRIEALQRQLSKLALRVDNLQSPGES